MNYFLSRTEGIGLKQTFQKEGKSLRRRAAAYARARQFKRLKKVLKRQRTILGKLMRDVQSKLTALPEQAQATLTR